MALAPADRLMDACVMTQNEAEWRLELEESAQGTDLFEAPGGEAQVEDAREDAIDRIADPLGAGCPAARVETAKAKSTSPQLTRTGVYGDRCSDGRR
jgi:hypothetical protein